MWDAATINEGRPLGSIYGNSTPGREIDLGESSGREVERESSRL